MDTASAVADLLNGTTQRSALVSALIISIGTASGNSEGKNRSIRKTY